MKGYVVCVYKNITNEEKLKEYAIKARTAVEKYKGKFLIRGGRSISNNYKKKYFPPKIFLNKLYKKFTPYCSVATWYLWRSIDNEPIQY